MKRPWFSLATRHSYQGASWARAKGRWCAGPTTRQSREEVDDEDQADASRVHADVAVSAERGLSDRSRAAPDIRSGEEWSPASEPHPDEVLDWNQIFIDTLIATNTPNLLWPFQAGFEAGARVVDPSIEIRSTYLTEQGFSGFNSETLAFQAAERMYRRGADVIYHAAGASGFGLFEAALQLSDDLGRHLWGIGVDTDQYRELSAGDPWRPHVLTSMVKRYDQAVYALLAAYARGTFAPGSRELELDVRAVDISCSGGFIDDIRPQIEEFRRQIIAGEIVVPSTPAEKAGA